MTREEIIKECDKMSQLKGIGDKDFYASISRELKKAEKLEKVIEILKEKPTLADLDFKYSYEEQCKFYYVKYYEVYNREPEERFYCTKEKYELLKEVLKK